MSEIPRSLVTLLGRERHARLRGTIDFGRALVPLDIVLRMHVEDDRLRSVEVVLSDDQRVEADGPAHPTLTPRELKVVSLIGLGMSTDEIARVLVIAPGTVRSHVRNAMSKTEAHTRAQLVARVMNGDGRWPDGRHGDQNGSGTPEAA